jgi:2-C-methyl-D-erythritol 2,4-cyclodiphosphate synthase
MHMAGLAFDTETGPVGHSDGDVACHAGADALLSAAGLGDLGQIFGTDDPAWADAAGTVLLGEVARKVREAGWAIQHLSIQVIGNTPRLSPRRQEAERVLTETIGAPVSVAATTTDGLGFTGRGEGVAAMATTVLSRANG